MHSAAFWTGLEGEFGGAPRLPGLSPLLSRSLTRGSRDWRERPWPPARQPVRRRPPTRFNRLADGCGMPTTPCPAEAGVIGAGHRRPRQVWCALALSLTSARQARQVAGQYRDIGFQVADAIAHAFEQEIRVAHGIAELGIRPV